MANWKRRLEEIIAEVDGEDSPAKVRFQELENLIREYCQEIIAEELQKITAKMVYDKIFEDDAKKVHEEPQNTTLKYYDINGDEVKYPPLCIETVTVANGGIPPSTDTITISNDYTNIDYT